MGFAFDSLVRTIVDFSLFTFMGNVFSVLDVLVIICTLGFTIVLMGRVPKFIKELFLARLGTRFRKEENLREWDSADKKKTIELNKKLIEYLSKFLYWGILLIGITLALMGGRLDLLAEQEINGFSLSLMIILRFFGIILITVFLSRIVPIWLINIVFTFIVNLKIFKFRGVGGSLLDRPILEGPSLRKLTESDQLSEYFVKFLHWCILLVGITYAFATLGFEPDAQIHLLGADMRILDIVNSILAAVITLVFVFYFLPPVLNILLTSILGMYEKRNSDEKEKIHHVKTEVTKIKPGLHRTLLYLFLLVGIHAAISYLPDDAFYSFLEFIDVIIKALIILASAFLLTILIPIFIYANSSSRDEIRRSNLYQIGRYITYLVLIFALFLIMGTVGLDPNTTVALGESNVTVWSFTTAILVIIVTIMASKMIVTMLRDTLLHPDLIDQHASRVLERLTYIIIICIGIAIALGVMGVNILAVATGLGLIGFALAFGMQDTIANFMAGIMIAVERPFKIGDRIRVGDEWGDVVDIGLRSTQILTVKNETVTIPNNLIATREVWNFTKENPSIILTTPIGISYDSDWHKAESIVLRIARKHPLVLGKPEPHVRMKRFGESSIDLELWAWISHAKYMEIVRSDLLKSVKDKFDLEGILIPYPHRTIVFKRDIDEIRFSQDSSLHGDHPSQTRLF